jgi:DNA-binding NtrC family response regulator
MTFPDDWFPRPQVPTPGLGHSVLVVDDEEIVRHVAHRYLTNAGYRVFEADNMAEAFAVLERARIDLVLMDVVMPAPDGVMIAALIHRRWPEQRILFMSAHSDEVLLEHQIGEGLRDFLIKPFTRDELVMAIARALDRRRAPREPESDPADGPPSRSDG